jgi:hypothetical protein
MLEEAYDKAEMKNTQVYGRHKRFRDGRASVNDDPLCRRPSTPTNDDSIECLRNVVRNDR